MDRYVNDVQRLSALSDPVRLRCLSLLADGRELCVCKLVETLGLPQSTVSRHLSQLRKAGWIVARRDGRWMHYRLADKSRSPWRRVLACVLSAVEHPMFAKDASALESSLISETKH
jgi:ArsR family transcriptional regulator